MHLPTSTILPSTPPDVESKLSIDALGDVWEAVYTARTKSFKIGLILRVPVDTLDSIAAQFADPGDKLLETLKVWLKTATKPTWQAIVDALRNATIGEASLATDVEAKYCTAVEAGRASGQTMPEVQPTATEIQLQSLQEELRQIKDQLQDSHSQRRMDTLQQELQKPKTQQLPVTKGTETQSQKALVQQKTIRDMKWQKQSKAPEKMYRGSAASDSNMAYFNGCGSTKVYSYDSDTKKWHQLPDTPHTNSTLVVAEHILTMVGGYVSSKVTNSLLSLMGEGGAMKWLPHYPAMPTARGHTAAVCSGHSLIVTGGKSDRYNRLATVEVLDIDAQQWSTACSLPHPFSCATISICRERLYLMGGIDKTGHATHSVLTCSVPELLQSQTEKLRMAPAKQTTKWRRIADAPYYYSSCATLCGQLVAVGGRKDDKDTAAIFIHNATTDSWEAMGDMPTARHRALVAILNGKLMVVGGIVGSMLTDVVEILC